MIDPTITTALMRQTCALIGSPASSCRLIAAFPLPPESIGPETLGSERSAVKRPKRRQTLPIGAVRLSSLGNAHVCRPWTRPRDPRRRPRRRVRVAEPDPGAGDSAPARGPRRDRSGPDRIGQDGGVRAPDAPVRQPGRARGPGPRADADPRAVHPGDPGAAGVRPAQGHRRRGRVRWRADPLPAGAATGRRPRRRGDGRTGQGPDLAPLADAPRVPLHRARRGRRDARPRLPRGRREDPGADPVEPPDRAVLGDDAARDQAAGRSVPVRPGDGQGQGRDADGRHRRAVRARGHVRGRRPTSSSRCSAPSGRTRRSCSCGPRCAPSSCTARCATAG